MYGKIFDSIYDGTLLGHWEAIVTFQQMIVLADADGIVDMTPQAIASRTSIPLEIITAGLKVLCEPDPDSRTPGEDGRRIILIDAHRTWGWLLVNHEKYKNLQDADTVRAQTRERVRRHRALKREVTDVTPGNAEKRHTDTDTDTDTKAKPSSAKADVSTPMAPPCPHLEIIALYHKHLPTGRQVKPELWKGTRAKHLQARWREEVKRQKLGWWEKFFVYCAGSDFLTGKAPVAQGRKPFEIDLEWIVNPTNFVKIYEGKYHS